MSDITKCNDMKCDRKETCYRFTAPASDWQSYFTESPRVENVCKEYWNRVVTK